MLAGRRLDDRFLFFFIFAWFLFAVAVANLYLQQPDKYESTLMVCMLYGILSAILFTSVGADKEKLLIKGGLSPRNVQYGLGLFAFLQLVIALFSGLGLLRALPGGNPIFAGLLEKITDVYIAMVGQTLIAITEEALFRGIILRNHLNRQDFWQINLAQAWAFAIVHVYRYGLQLGVLGFFILVGLVFGYVVKKTGSIIPCMIAHLLNNMRWAMGG